MLTTISLEEMEFRAGHGCYEMEKRVGGRFAVNLTLTAETDDAAAADDVSKCINYLEVYDIVSQQMSIASDTIENAALRILDALKEKFPQTRHAKVTVSKIAPPLGGKVARVSATLER